MEEKESQITNQAAAIPENKKDLKNFIKQKAQESKDIERALDARKTQLHRQFV